VAVFGSFFMSRDTQDYGLTLSSLQRYTQPVVPVSFATADANDYEDRRSSLMLGVHARLSDRTDVSYSYSFTRAETDYTGAGSAELALVARYRGIDADIHDIDLELGHWVRPGLRVMAGYGLQYYGDGSPRPASIASVVSPFDLTTLRHIVTVGVTLTSDLLED
jgi:hypothetical protein